MTETISLQELSLMDALNLAVAKSGLTREDIAASMQWGTSHANRVFAPENYWPTLPSLGKLCAVVQNTILLDWARAQAEAGGLRFEAEKLDCTALVLRMGKLFSELGDVARIGEEAIKNGNISKGEARKLIRELVDLANDTLGTINGLRSIAGNPSE